MKHRRSLRPRQAVTRRGQRLVTAAKYCFSLPTRLPICPGACPNLPCVLLSHLPEVLCADWCAWWYLPSRRFIAMVDAERELLSPAAAAKA